MNNYHPAVHGLYIYMFPVPPRRVLHRLILCCFYAFCCPSPQLHNVCVCSLCLPSSFFPYKAMLSTVSFCHIYRPVSHSSRLQNSICDSAGEAACCDQLQFSGQQSLYRTRSCWALVSHQSTYLQIFYSIFLQQIKKTFSSAVYIY